MLDKTLTSQQSQSDQIEIICNTFGINESVIPKRGNGKSGAYLIGLRSWLGRMAIQRAIQATYGSGESNVK